MNDENQLIQELEKRLAAIRSDDVYSKLYAQSIKSVIDKIKEGYYRNVANEFKGSHELVYDLRVLGYFDLARQEEMRQFAL